MVAQDCARMYRANAVLTASPGQLVLMMFDGALKAMALARRALALPSGDLRRIETANNELVKAQQIFRELQVTLRMDAGDGKFAAEMHRLYDYFIQRLLEANIRKNEMPIIEVENLFVQVRDAWAEMLRRQDPAYSSSSRSAA